MNSIAAFQKCEPEINQVDINMEDFRKFKAWRDSRLLLFDIYDITRNFPDKDAPQFKNLTRKLAVLISGNIVRGLQEKNPDLRDEFLNNAESCMNRLNILIQAAYKKGYLQESVTQNLFNEIRRSLDGIQHLSDRR